VALSSLSPDFAGLSHLFSLGCSVELDGQCAGFI
jgi:hypothetical protein